MQKQGKQLKYKRSNFILNPTGQSTKHQNYWRKLSPTKHGHLLLKEKLVQ